MAQRLAGAAAEPANGGTLASAASDGATTAERRWLLERVDDGAVVQLYADGFEKLPREQRLLCWHLCEAAIAGRDIYLDQRHRDGVVLRDLVEETLVALRAIGARWQDDARAAGADEADLTALADLRRYARLLWLHSGPYHQITSRKFTLRCAPAAFARLVERAAQRGAKLPLRAGETRDALLARLAPLLFDATHEPMVTCKDPPPGKDLLTASANNLYGPDVTLADLAGFEERHALNSRLAKGPDGKLVEQVWRAGFDHLVPPGLYAAPIGRIVAHLEAAIPFATPRMARALGTLIRWYRTGEEADFRDYCIAWVADQESPVDTVNGFIEVYVDPRGVKGTWQAMVSIDDPARMEQIRQFATHAQWFEDRMPIEPAYRKPQVKGISAKAIEVVIEVGDCGPMTPIGVNLPNPQDLREQYGSKSVSLGNVVEAYEKSAPEASRREFCFDDAEAARSKQWKALCAALTTNMHEVIGHASGRSAPGLAGDPAVHLKECYSALEEARADLVALCFIGDPKLVELGLLDDPRAAQLAEYEAYTRNALTQLNRVKEGDTLEEDHMRNRQLVVQWIRRHAAAIEERCRDGKTFWCVVDQDAWHAGACRLLREVQRIKSEGDYAAGKALVDEYGRRFDPRLRDEVVARFAALDLPSYSGFVQPELVAVRDASGALVDARITYPCDLETQMLRFSGRLPRAG
ncbi:MAG: peptidase M49 [Planctomycetes bacterium]|nr:peptidase M49 [Planctomycetota bacterium]